jgi:hypothetical protein
MKIHKFNVFHVRALYHTKTLITLLGRNMQECVTIDDKTLFVHLLMISVFEDS